MLAGQVEEQGKDIISDTQMKELVEVAWTDTDKEEPVTKKEQYYLLHWGLKCEVIDVGEGRMVGVSYSVAICQNIKTGEVMCFPPEQLRILGTEIKK